MKTNFLHRPFFQQQSLALVRCITGLFLIYHGLEVFNAELMHSYQEWDTFKHTFSPALFVYVGKGGELVAGILLCLGLLTRLGALITIVIMSYIVFVVSHGKIWYEDQHPFMFVLIALLFFFRGGGSYSLDGYLFSTHHK